MRLRRLPQAESVIKANKLVLQEDEAPAGEWRQLLSLPAQSTLNLEIGMGRGKFITAACLKEPGQGWLGLEMRPEMHFMALRRLPDEAPANLRFLWLNAVCLGDIFRAGEVDNIFLPFPDPWPKARHAKRRLTHQSFLARYQKILTKNGRIVFKTDNQDFYFWSKESFLANGWHIGAESEDLPPDQSDIPTEYEERYRGRGLPIYFLALSPPGDGPKE